LHKFSLTFVYRRIKAEFRDESTLRHALADVCQARRIEFETGEGLALYGFEGDRRRETAELVIRRRHLGRLTNDLGFHRRPDSTFEVIISDFDSRHTAAEVVREVKQRYARLQVEKLARARGYRIEEVPAEGEARRGPSGGILCEAPPDALCDVENEG
jgi:hypothetical protein